MSRREKGEKSRWVGGSKSYLPDQLVVYGYARVGRREVVSDYALRESEATEPVKKFMPVGADSGLRNAAHGGAFRATEGPLSLVRGRA